MTQSHDFPYCHSLAHKSARFPNRYCKSVLALNGSHVRFQPSLRIALWTAKLVRDYPHRHRSTSSIHIRRGVCRRRRRQLLARPFVPSLRRTVWHWQRCDAILWEREFFHPNGAAVAVATDQADKSGPSVWCSWQSEQASNNDANIVASLEVSLRRNSTAPWLTCPVALHADLLNPAMAATVVMTVIGQ